MPPMSVTVVATDPTDLMHPSPAISLASQWRELSPTTMSSSGLARLPWSPGENVAALIAPMAALATRGSCQRIEKQQGIWSRVWARWRVSKPYYRTDQGQTRRTLRLIGPSIAVDIFLKEAFEAGSEVCGPEGGHGHPQSLLVWISGLSRKRYKRGFEDSSSVFFFFFLSYLISCTTYFCNCHRLLQANTVSLPSRPRVLT